MKPAQRRSRGYTMVELLISIGVFAIGVTGVVAMQKVTLASNQHARALSIATRIAQSWQDQLAADAASWNSPGPGGGASDLADTRWLQQVNPPPRGWFVPAYSPDGLFGNAFDALGNVVPPGQPQQAAFCAQVRLSWIMPENEGEGLIRSEVRVYWLRDGGGGHLDAPQPLCTVSNMARFEQAVERYHFVYQTTAIRQNTTP